MKKRILLLLVALFAINLVSAATYYISPTGNDNTGTGTSTQPWATLTRAIDAVQPGDTVFIMPGTYYPTATMELHKQGSQNAWITIKSDGGAIFNGSRMSTAGRAILELSRYEDNGQDMYWVIDGIKFLSSTRAGIRLNHVDNVIIKNVEAGYNNDWGIFSSFSNYLHFINVDCHHTVLQHGLYLSNSGDNQIVENSTFHDNNGCGIHHNGDASMGGDGIISNSTIRNNVLYRNGLGGGSAINLDGVMDSRVYNNLIYDNYAKGIGTYMIDGAAAGNNIIAYNTIYSGTGDSVNGIIIKRGSNGNTVINNLIVVGSGQAIEIDSDSTNQAIDYNAYYRYSSASDLFSYEDIGLYTLAQWRQQFPSFDAHSILIDNPSNVFVDINNLDFSLKSSSAVIDKASIQYTVNSDKIGVLRPQGNGYDIGAYEYPASIQYHPADTNHNSIIEMKELILFIGLWKNSQANINDVLTALDRWFRGN